MSLFAIVLSSMVLLTPTIKEAPTAPITVKSACAFATSTKEEVMYSPCTVVIGENERAKWVAFDMPNLRVIYLGDMINAILDVKTISVNGVVSMVKGACVTNGNNQIQCIADIDFVTVGVIAIAQ